MKMEDVDATLVEFWRQLDEMLAEACSVSEHVHPSLFAKRRTLSQKHAELMSELRYYWTNFERERVLTLLRTAVEDLK